MKVGNVLLCIPIAFAVAEGITALIFKRPYDFLRLFDAIWYAYIGVYCMWIWNKKNAK